MSNIVEQAKVAVALDGRDAETVLGELTAKTEKYTDALTKAFQAGDKVGMKNALKDLKETEKQMAAVQKQTFDVTKVMKNLNGTSLKDLKKAEYELNVELSKMTRGTQEYINKSKDLQKVSAEIRKVKTEMSGVTTQSGGLAGKFKELLPALGATAIIGGVISLGKAILQTRGEFQKYEAVLKNTLGSEDASRQAMTMLTETASTLPISLKEATESFIKLANRGMVPTQDEMRKLTDVAMSQGKSLDMFVEAMLDAQTGEFERLKEYGVRAKSEGDKVTFTFKGQTQTVQKTDEAIKAYLLSLGDMEGVSGSSAAVMGTLEGKVSNLGDAWDNMLNNMGKNTQGILSTAIGWLSDFVTNVGIAFMSVEQIKQQVMDAQDLSNYQNAMQEIKNSTDMFVKDGMKLKEAEAKAADLYAKGMQNSINIAKQDLETATGVQKEKLEKRIASYEKELEAVNGHYKKLKEVELKGLKLTDAQKEEAYKKSLAALEETHAKQLALEKNRYANGQIGEETYNQNIFNLETIFLEARIKLLTAYGKDTGDLENKLADERLARVKKEKEAELKIRKQIADDIKAMEKEGQGNINDENKNVDEQAADASEFISDSELDQMDARREFLKQYKSDSLAEDYEMEMQHLESLELAYEDYQAGRIAIGAKYAEKYLAQSQELLGAVSESVSIAKQAELDTVEAEKESELAALEDKFKRGLISEDKYNAQKTSLEQKYKEKEKNISKKYAGTEYTMKIAEIMTSQAMAIANIWSKHAWNPVMAALLTGLAIWNTSNQIASARANYQKAMQAYKGRYDVIGKDDNQLYTNVPYIGEATTGYYPNKTLISERGGEVIIDNPTVRNIQLNAPDILPRIMANRVPQRAEGSYPAASAQSSGNDNLNATLMAMIAVMNNLVRILPNIRAKVVMDEFKEAEAEFDALKSDVTRR